MSKSLMSSFAAWLMLVSVPLHAESWHCRNTVEVQCHAGECAAETQGITPLDVRFDASGGFSVCAYSGCWEGAGKAVRNPPHLLISAAQVDWSDPSRREENRSDVAIAFDSTDSIALVKAGVFALPMACSAAD